MQEREEKRLVEDDPKEGTQHTIEDQMEITLGVKTIAHWFLGQKVHYQPEHYKKDDKFENGIVKNIHPDMDKAWVVYHCGGDWKNYQDYTGALTNFDDLKEGWR